MLINLPGSSTRVQLQGTILVVDASLLAIALVLPFALFASLGQVYRLPIGVATLTMMINWAPILGWSEFFL